MFLQFFSFCCPIFFANADMADIGQKQLQQQMQVQQKFMQQEYPSFQNTQTQTQDQPQQGETRSRYYRRKGQPPVINNYYYYDMPSGYYYPQGGYSEGYYIQRSGPPGSYRDMVRPDYYNRDQKVETQDSYQDSGYAPYNP